MNVLSGNKTNRVQRYRRKIHVCARGVSFMLCMGCRLANILGECYYFLYGLRIAIPKPIQLRYLQIKRWNLFSGGDVLKTTLKYRSPSDRNKYTFINVRTCTYTVYTCMFLFVNQLYYFSCWSTEMVRGKLSVLQMIISSHKYMYSEDKVRVANDDFI
jgi:hypothetical protein